MGPYPNRPLVKPPPDGEELVTDDNPELVCASAGSSTLEARVVCVYDQPQPRTRAQNDLEIWWRFMAQCVTFPPHETRAHRTGGYLPIRDARKGQSKNRTMVGKARPVCGECGKDFGRAQELNRHRRDKHMSRKRCPFCHFTWTRPDKIKSHLLRNHAEGFTADILEGVDALCGRGVIDFVNAYDHGPEVEATLRCFNYEVSQP